MAVTRAFRSGNSQAVRIHVELAYADSSLEPTITRRGEVITIFPLRRDLKRAVAALRSMPKPAAVEQREPIELPDRD